MIKINKKDNTSDRSFEDRLNEYMKVVDKLKLKHEKEIDKLKKDNKLKEEDKNE